MANYLTKRTMGRYALGTVTILNCCVWASRLPAQWSTNAASNNAIVARQGSNQVTPIILRDGRAGAVLIWVDQRNGNSDIFGQRIGADGRPGWEDDGKALVIAPNGQECPAVIALDGDFVTAWRDRRNNPSVNGIRVQRFNLAGEPLWQSATVAHQANNFAPDIFVNGDSDILTTSYSTALFDDVISMQILDGNGTARFIPQKILNDQAKGRQANIRPAAAPGLEGGLIAAWVDARNDTSLFYNAMSGQGANWPAGEQVLSTAIKMGTNPVAFSDAAEGAIIVWIESDPSKTDLVRAARVDPTGSRIWTPAVVTLATGVGSKRQLAGVSNGTGGAYLAWANDSGSGPRIILQHLNVDGTFWSDDVMLATSTGAQANPALAVNGDGEALVAWEDDRNSNADIYAQSADLTGNIKWDPAGQAVSTAFASQTAPMLTDDGLGGAIVTWQDTRGGDADVYLQRVSKTGVLGEFRTLAVSAPAAGTNWEVGSSQTIVWSATTEIDSIRIDVSLDGGQQYSPLFAALPNSNPQDNRITITVPGPASAQARLRFTVIEAPFIVQESEPFTVSAPMGPAVNAVAAPEAALGDSIEISSTASDLSGVRDVRLHYQPGGADRFDSSSMFKEADRYRGIIPTQDVTERGIRYFVSATDSIGTVGYSDTAAIVTTFPRGTETASLDFGFDPSAYRMIGAPNSLQESLADSVLAASGFGVPDSSRWRLFRYESNQNIERDSLNLSTFRFEPGQAYWIISSRSRTIDYGAGKSLPPDQAFSVTLRPGWNQVSNPFAFAIAWDDILAASGGAVLSRPSAFRGAYVQPSALDPYEGYFVFNFADHDIPLVFPPIETSPKQALISNYSGGDWQIQIKAVCGKASDEINFIGTDATAEDNWDRLDQPEPPVIGDYVSIFFPHEDWLQFPNKYTTDFRSALSGKTDYSLEVQTNIPGSSVTLEFHGIDSLPENLTAVLYDDKLSVAQDLRQDADFSFASGHAGIRKSLRLLVGSRSDVPGLHSSEFIPEDFELSQNFPNPFNPATTIRYGLPRAELVTIKIFDLLGREVRTLLDAELTPAGFHLVTWDGRDQRAKPVASGFYIYRIVSGEFSRAQKMLLLK